MAANRFREPTHGGYMPRADGSEVRKRSRSRFGFPNLPSTKQEAIHRRQRKARRAQEDRS